MAASQLTWHNGPDGDRRSEPIELEDHAQTSVFYATGQDLTTSGRWTLARFDVYSTGRTNVVRLGESGTLTDCRQRAEDDLVELLK